MPIPAADVLVVEDDEPTQSFLRVICKRFGYTTATAGDGEEAKRLIDGRSDWRVILLDLYLPKCNGFEVIAHMKVNAPRLLPRTIVVTAGGEGDIQRARNLKLVNSVLRKPVDIYELAARMAECAAMPAAQPVSQHQRTT